MGDPCVEGGGRSSKGLKTQYEDAGFVVAGADSRRGGTFVGDLCTKHSWCRVMASAHVDQGLQPLCTCPTFGCCTRWCHSFSVEVTGL